MGFPSTIGLYIHIPFCHARCGYCDFVTFTGKEDKVGGYVDDLCHEMKMYSSFMAVTPTKPPHGSAVRPTSGGVGVQTPSDALVPGFGRDDLNGKKPLGISTVFVGGGTPSILESNHLAILFSALRSHFAVDPDAEMTLEANPESITPAKAAAWKREGINRISIGLQVFDNALLKKIDRLHTVEEFVAAYDIVRKTGFENVNVDLIYGFEGQRLASWRATLESTVALNPEHLSLYALKIEEHTPFAAQGTRVNDDAQADMYEWARLFLKEQGYEHYEISNFSRPGRACRHNLIYWRQKDYLGLGVGAVGCAGGTRWENHKNLHDYHEDITAGRLPRVKVESLDASTQHFERLMLGLRLREGLAWGNETNAAWMSARAKLQAQGLLEEIRPGYWRVAESAVALTNQVLLAFLP